MKFPILYRPAILRRPDFLFVFNYALFFNDSLSCFNDFLFCYFCNFLFAYFRWFVKTANFLDQARWGIPNQIIVCIGRRKVLHLGVPYTHYNCAVNSENPKNGISIATPFGSFVMIRDVLGKVSGSTPRGGALVRISV